VYPAPFDVRLFYAEDESDDTVVQPDIVVICDEKKRGTEGCRGAPDLVVEILSPSNTAIEMERKRRLYQEAGVREYWLVDPGGKLDINGSQEKIPESKSLTVYRFQDGEILTNTYKSTDAAPVTILPGLLIPLEEVFAE
jgi:Uma2 family endonuclease